VQISEIIKSTVLQNKVKFPIARYHMNFGKWETAANKDEGALYCHGHAHIVLTRKAAIHWTKNIDSQSEYGIFVGHVRTPLDEHQKDCERFFQFNLMTFMIKIESDVAELKSDVAELKSDVAELKSDVAELKSDVAELKSDVAELKSDVKAILAALQHKQ
jgi:outer membrane murein-binding lipoprotein Lpp